MIFQREISQQAYRRGKADKVIEKDYVMTWLLIGISGTKMKECCVFKGGTALKKVYFPDYRYSEDLDFTLIDRSYEEHVIGELSQVLKGLEKARAFVFNIDEEKIESRSDSLTIYIDFIGPLQARLGSRSIKVDFTLSEKIVCPVEERDIITTYSDCSGIVKKLRVYSLEEILIEKLCALIGRTEPRDLYDTHFLLGLGDLDYEAVSQLFPIKAGSKGIDATRLAGIFQQKQETIERLWKNRLALQVDDLPYLEHVIRETNRYLRRYRVT